MGLDMYLYAERRIDSYHYEPTKDGSMSKRDNLEYDQINSASGLGNLPDSDFGDFTIRKQVGYWRKANAVHGWIVRNLANGVDECQEILMERSDLTALRNACVTALANRNNPVPAAKIKDKVKSTDDLISIIKNQLETQPVVLADPLSVEPTSGFFFGGTEKDEYYYQTLEYTVDLINSLIAGAGNDVYFYYRASW
jgi:hypothetical protein